VTRPALAAARAVEVLNFLASHPGESFTLSELSRHLNLNMASGLSVLKALTDAGYVHRHHSHKTYSLGPALVAVGYAALARYQVIDIAVEEMRRLAADCDTECVASVVVGDEIVIVGASGRPRLEGADVRVGQRVPIIPPIGPIFLAWGESPRVERWLDALGPGAEESERELYRGAVATVRRRGFSVGLESGARAQSGRALIDLVNSPRDERLRGRALSLIAAMRHDYLVIDLESTAPLLISNLAAPVFGVDGEVVLALTLQGFAEPMNGPEISAVADRLLSSTLHVTRESGGHAPPDFLAGRGRNGNSPVMARAYGVGQSE
jgi:DNA-binding IclR family transcriptional regulator